MSFSEGMSCHNCKNKDKPGTGCIDDAPIPAWELDGVNYTRCPVTLLVPEMQIIMRLYLHYKNNNLAVSGGILDQTNQYLQAMELIDSIAAEYQNKKE